MPEPGLVPLARILEARDLVARRVHRTPILRSTAAGTFAAAAGRPIAAGQLLMKAEHLQVTGSFKPRGMVWRVATLTPEQRGTGIVTLSAGNAAQAYAWAGREAGVRTVVTMPETAVRSKVEACLGYGAEIELHGTHVGETLARVEQIQAEQGLFFAHPFDDPEVIAGHGSLGLELLEEVPDVDVVVIGIGGGGLISGVATAIKETRPGVRVYGVEPETSDAMARALAAGEIVRIEPRSVADGLGAPFAGAWTLPICQHYLDGIVLIDDPTILAGVRFAVERMKQILEPAGAAALAAVLFGKVPIRPGERVVVVASGGNVELSRLGELIAAAAPFPVHAGGPPSKTPEPEPTTPEPTEPTTPEPTTPEPTEPPPQSFSPPTARSVVGRGFDLALHATGQLRRASLLIALQFAGVAAPLVVLAVAIGVVAPDLYIDAELGVIDETASSPVLSTLMALNVLMVIAFIGLVAVLIDGQAIAIALLGGQLVQRTMRLPEAAARARQVFWRLLRGSLLIGIPLALLYMAIRQVIGADPASAELALLVSAIATAVAGAPFTYLATGIVLGDVGPLEAAGRSVTLFSTRPRVAFTLALYAAVANVVALFALSAGADVLLRVSETLGLGFEGSPLRVGASYATVVVAVLASGSLLFTMNAIIVSPQVVAFVGLTHHAGGLDRARLGAEAAGPVVVPGNPWESTRLADRLPNRRLVSIPMRLLILAAVIAAATGLVAVAQL